MASVWPLASAEPFVKERCEKPFLFKQYLFAHYSVMDSKAFFFLMDFTHIPTKATALFFNLNLTKW